MIKDRMNKANDRLKLIKALEKLRTDLDKLGPVPNNVENKKIYNPWMGDYSMLAVPKDLALYDYAVRFFDIIAKFQDSKVLKPGLLSYNLDTLIEYVNNSGRCEYGWVRSKPGEQVTENNVYLGDVFGIWTFTIKHFKESAKKTNDSTHDFTQWAIQVYQLQSFLTRHVGPMKDLINTVILSERLAKYNLVDTICNKIASRGQRG